HLAYLLRWVAPKGDANVCRQLVGAVQYRQRGNGAELAHIGGQDVARVTPVDDELAHDARPIGIDAFGPSTVVALHEGVATRTEHLDCGLPTPFAHVVVVTHVDLLEVAARYAHCYRRSGKWGHRRPWSRLGSLGSVAAHSQGARALRWSTQMHTHTHH